MFGQPDDSSVAYATDEAIELDALLEVAIECDANEEGEEGEVDETQEDTIRQYPK